MYGNSVPVLIDTDVIINFLRGRDEEASFFHRVLVGEEFSACYAAITEVELYSAAKINQRQSESIQMLMNNLHRVGISSPVAQLAGQLLGKFRKSHGLEIADAIIAASTIIQGACLVTENTKHFAFIPGLIITPPSAYMVED